MWCKQALGQLIHLHKQHVSSTFHTRIYVGCPRSCFSFSLKFSASRRSRLFRDKENEDKMKASARVLWDYLRIDNPPKKSDLIFILGNSDLRTADYAAKLYQEGFAPLVVVSGNAGHGTSGKWDKPEAHIFAEQLLKKQVPAESIILESEATNTGENIRFTQQLLRGHPHYLQPQSLMLIQTPFMGRRSLSTFLKQWDNAGQVDIMVSSPPISLEAYPDEAAGYSHLGDVVVEMLSSMQRILQYPDKGFQVPQHVPSNVLEAFRDLLSQTTAC